MNPMSPPIIHVLDDDRDVRASLSRLLEAAGYEVRAYASAGDFLDAPPDDRPGCLILDLHMPGPSGLDLQQALARSGRTRPIIFLSGYEDAAARTLAMKAGAAAFLTKPIPGGSLLQAVGDALAAQPAGGTVK